MLLTPIKNITSALKDIAEGEGDLTVRLDDSGKHELSETAKWFNVFMGRLQELMSAVAGTVSEVATTGEVLTKSAEESARVTEQMAETVQQIASASQDQSAAAARTAAAVDQLNSAIARVVDSTDHQTQGVRRSVPPLWLTTPLRLRDPVAAEPPPRRTGIRCTGQQVGR